MCDGFYDCLDRTDESGCDTAEKDEDCDENYIDNLDLKEAQEFCQSGKECPGKANFCGNSTYWRGNLLCPIGERMGADRRLEWLVRLGVKSVLAN